MKNYLSCDLNDALKTFLEGINYPYYSVEFDRLGVMAEELFLDPITNRVINFPVKLHGITYDFDTIDMLEFNANGQARNPFSNKLFTLSEVLPDVELNGKIKNFIASTKGNVSKLNINIQSSMSLEITIDNAIQSFCDHRINGHFALENMEIPIAKLAELTNQFHAKALFIYAVCFEIGFNVSACSKKYIKYLRYAVEQGLGIAHLAYANCCEYGTHGVPKNNIEAAKNYEMAANQGITIAIYNYAQCLAFGLGVEQDIIKAAQLFKRAADCGYAKAQFNYARCCEKGYGMAINLDESEVYFKLAAAQSGPLDHNMPKIQY